MPIIVALSLALALAPTPDPPVGACYRLFQTKCFDPDPAYWCISCYCVGEFIACEGEVLAGGMTWDRVLTTTPNQGRDPLIEVSYPWRAKYPDCEDDTCYCEYFPEVAGYCDGWTQAQNAVPCP